MPRKKQPAKPKKYTKNWSTTPGVYHSLPEHEYHADTEAVSKSQLDMVDRSPRHWKWGIANPRERTPTMLMGAMIHCMILEPKLFGGRFIIPPKINRRTSIGKAQWAEWQKSIMPGQTLVEAEKVDIAKNMAESVWHNDNAAWILKDSVKEVTVVWKDDKAFREQLAATVGMENVIYPEPTGMFCKARIDSWRPADGIWADVKTSADASPEGFARACFNYRYHVQAGFYTDGGAVHGVDPAHFAYIVVENTPPYVCQVYRAVDVSLDLGRILYSRNMETLHRCQKSGLYHGYALPMDGNNSQILDVDLPPWAYNAENI